jgi:hypothetical protein
MLWFENVAGLRERASASGAFAIMAVFPVPSLPGLLQLRREPIFVVGLI